MQFVAPFVYNIADHIKDKIWSQNKESESETSIMPRWEGMHGFVFLSVSTFSQVIISIHKL
jgi:hypothetical protein